MNVISFSFPNIPHVHCAFQTRIGGKSKGPYKDGNIAYTVDDNPDCVLANRKMLLSELGLPAWAEENQVHGDDMVFDAEKTDLRSQGGCDADGLTTTRKNLALLIKTADCQPILISDLDGSHIAALHVGWRGNRIGFIESAVARFCAHYNLLPQNLSAVRGPSIGPKHSEFVNFDAEWGEDFLPWFNIKTKLLDLWELTRHQLRQTGILNKNIFSLDLCTFERDDLFFSHRRDKGRSGRQASLIWIS